MFPRPILRLLAVAAIVAVLLAVLAFVAGRAGRASSAPAPPTTTAGVGYVPGPAGPPVTDPNGQWLPEPDPSSSAGGER
jgi:hypothetical protein